MGRNPISRRHIRGGAFCFSDSFSHSVVADLVKFANLSSARIEFFYLNNLGSHPRGFWCLTIHLWHSDYLIYRDAYRHSCQFWYCFVYYGNLSAAIAAAFIRCNSASSRYSKHHLRHVGTVCFCANFCKPHCASTTTLDYHPFLLVRCLKGRLLGIGLLPAGIILGIMVIPFISSVMQDVFKIVPSVLKESATPWGARLGKSCGKSFYLMVGFR